MSAAPAGAGPSPEALLAHVESFRIDAARRLAPARRAALGQFFTPAPVSRLMASMLSARPRALRVLDAGAGVGSLTAAMVAEVCGRAERPREMTVVAYEVDPVLVAYLLDTFDACGAACGRAGIRFVGEIRQEDFIRAGVAALEGGGLFPGDGPRYDTAILNPPYRKIAGDSEVRRRLRRVGIEASNLYAAFVWLAVRLLGAGGEVVALTPRSFCNGPYFRPFRRALAGSVGLRRVHVFESRDRAFADDDVLQENIICHAVKSAVRGRVAITTSAGPGDAEDATIHEVGHDELIRPGDPDAVLHVVADEAGHRLGEWMRGLPCTLADVGVGVSTGRVVEFRAKGRILADPAVPGATPLVYPHHFANGYVQWPHVGGKVNALAAAPADAGDDDLLPTGFYVLVRRFSAKEERRRVVAAVHDPGRVPGPTVAFENHLNYLHCSGEGLPPALAKGLAAFLNSTAVDIYFRQFSGHTQVNARDLRGLRYPTEAGLSALGRRIGDRSPDQDELDRIIREELFAVADATADPSEARKKLDDALAVLRAVRVPKAQQNDRSALTLLALLDLKPATPWAAAANPPLGITPILDWIAAHYGKRYAPNTRETIRRFTVHPFEQIGLLVSNPDDPTRPPNSPANVYQIEAGALDLLRAWGGGGWATELAAYAASAEGINRLRLRERSLARVPVTLPDGTTLRLTPGGQNVLIRQVVEAFCPRFTPGGHVAYVGDAGEKHLHHDEAYLAGLGVRIDPHGRMPDVVVHDRRRDWLVLVEAVTSHGPIHLLRHNQLKDLFAGSRAGLVFVTAFIDRRAMKEYLPEIAWETEVWVADAPDHLIHFNGERFLGPHSR